MNNETGYQQAIENLAYHIRRLSDQTQVQILDQLITEDPTFLGRPDELMIACAQQMTPDQLQDWNKLENIYNVIATTYDKPDTQVFTETQARVLLLDIESGFFDDC